MATRILDTSVLICHYDRMTRSKTVESVKAHARHLIAIENTKWVLSPIRIEFLCGALSSDEFKLFSSYLEPFEVLDKRK